MSSLIISLFVTLKQKSCYMRICNFLLGSDKFYADEMHVFLDIGWDVNVIRGTLGLVWTKSWHKKMLIEDCVYNHTLEIQLDAIISTKPEARRS